jgi:hypothetical protein
LIKYTRREAMGGIYALYINIYVYICIYIYIYIQQQERAQQRSSAIRLLLW